MRALTVIRTLNEIARDYKTVVIVVTLNDKIIPTFKRLYHICDGATDEEQGQGREIT